MPVVVGTALVLVTWAGVILVLACMGLLLALWLQPRGQVPSSRVVRQALWWGLLLATLFSMAAGLVAPLGSASVAAACGLVVLGLGVPGLILLIRRTGRGEGWPRTLPWITLYAALGLSVLYLAAAALGPVTNYDSGLYHLGAISYAREFATIPGLANLYSPLGYATAEFPLAAVLGNGPWSAEGFRLFNGLLMAMVAADVLLRARDRRRGPGFTILLVGVLAAWVPLLGLVDYWVTSPTQDSAAFVLTVTASAYLADAVTSMRARASAAGVVGALVIMLVLIRPTMAAYAVAALAVLILVLIRRQGGRGANGRGRVAALVLGLGAVAAVLTSTRDYLLSGWLQYPLSIYAFNVPWRAAEPSMDRLATLGFHRDPDQLWESVDGWGWVGAWWASRWSQWETYEWLGLVLLTAALLGFTGRRSGATLRGKSLTLVWLPSAVAVLFWWTLTPPSYRFAWGPLFTLATIPIGWVLWRLSQGESRLQGQRSRILPIMLLCVSLPIVIVIIFSAAVRMPWHEFTADRRWVLGVSIPYAVAPVIDVPVKEVTTTSGLILTQPTASDQCWVNFPLCTPRPYPEPRPRGDDLQSGLLPSSSH